MDHLVWIAPVSAVITLVGFVFHNNNKNDRRVSRVYSRLDEVKKDNETRYTNKEICAILHKGVDDKLDKIDKKLDKILNGQGGAH